MVYHGRPPRTPGPGNSSLWFKKEEVNSWGQSTWGFAKQILPLLLGGVLVAGFLLGRPGHEALIPEKWIQSLVGGNSLWANLFAAFAGALMYFATLTEVPILQGLIGSGMGTGAGPRFAPGRSCPEPAQHAGNPQRDRDPENARVFKPGGDSFHDRRDDLWRLARMNFPGLRVPPNFQWMRGRIEGGKKSKRIEHSLTSCN